MTPRRPALAHRADAVGAACTPIDAREELVRGPALLATSQAGTEHLTPTDVRPPDHRQTVLDQLHSEQARRVITLGAIRASLEEQPSPRSVRDCARRWCSDIVNLAETVVAALNSTENDQ